MCLNGKRYTDEELEYAYANYPTAWSKAAKKLMKNSKDFGKDDDIRIRNAKYPRVSSCTKPRDPDGLRSLSSAAAGLSGLAVVLFASQLNSLEFRFVVFGILAVSVQFCPQQTPCIRRWHRLTGT